jgi:hypothetical protein
MCEGSQETPSIHLRALFCLRVVAPLPATSAIVWKEEEVEG